jgi:hypothetical protein
LQAAGWSLCLCSEVFLLYPYVALAFPLATCHRMVSFHLEEREKVEGREEIVEKKIDLP